MFQTLKTLKLDYDEGIELQSIEGSKPLGDLDLVIFAREENMPHYVFESEFAKPPLEGLFQLFKKWSLQTLNFRSSWIVNPKLMLSICLG